jgi:hypothetical protein
MIPQTVTVEHEGRPVTAETLIMGSVLCAKVEDGRAIYGPIRSVPPEVDLRLMLKKLLQSAPDDPAYKEG